MGSIKKAKRINTQAPAYVYYKQLPIHDRINFKSYWYWFGRQRITLLQIKQDALYRYGLGNLKNSTITHHPY